MNTTRIGPELLENWFGKDAAKQIAEVSHQSGVYFHPQHGCCKAYFCGSHVGEIMSIYPEGWKTAAEHYLLSEEE